MPDHDSPDVLLLGAGHANLLATRALRAGLPGARITLIDASPQATYSGMFPGYVAGHYALADLQVDLAAFAARHGIRFVQGRVSRLDPASREVILDGAHQRIGYDLAALDVGSHSAMPEVQGFGRDAVAIKPLEGFAGRLATVDAGTPAAIIGGGVAGAEIALALTCRLSGPVTLIEAGATVAAGLGRRSRAYLRAALDRARVRVLTHAQVAAVEPAAVVLQDGRRIASRMTVGIAGARAHGWMAGDLPVDRAGFVRVGPSLQVEGHPTLFAVGDCASMVQTPRPKAGVFAVRQAPVLANNLIAAHRGAPLARYDPQRDYLKIISLGGKTALAEWHGLSLHGSWLWHWKDRIDRGFMRGLQGGLP